MSVSVTVICEASPQRALEVWREGLTADGVLVLMDPTWPTAMRREAGELVDRARAAGALAPRDLVVFTSGSSGRPRAVHRTRASWECSAAPCSEILGLRKDDVVGIPGPLRSTLFAFGAWHGLFSGCEVVAASVDELPTHPRGQAVSVVHTVPAMLPALCALRVAGRLSGLRAVVVAGDALSAELASLTTDLGLRVVEYYGAAELSFVGIRDAGGGGPMLPFPGVEVETRDGVLWSRSPYRMTSYLGPAGPMRLDAGGWATVGDLAETWGGGFVVRGRGDAAVTTGGHTVVVEEIESFLRRLPGVADAGVVGLPHPRLGQRMVAVVQPASGSLDDAQLRAACLELPAPARPRAFIQTRVPRAATGKIQRAPLRTLATEILAARRDASAKERAS
ncbi:MAG: AMP-binding protein [Dermatophilus congolensis]|nr:AMP-binding protein [Dermatophilus congolensis]